MDKNYSVLLQSRLPSFIKDDPSFSQFIAFFENYYTWFNDTYNVAGFGDKIDIDANYDLFLPYFQADFLPYFPDEIATDKIKLLKIVKELYKAKGVPDSFRFLFRALYNSYAEVTPTRDFVFKASDGKWIVPKSIKIKSTDFRFLNIQNLRILGTQSKTIGIVESSKLVGNRIQIYISNIERLYFSGETIKILDLNNKEVYFLNGEIVKYDTIPPNGSEALSSKIIGAISNIDIVSTSRGQHYKVGDPVVIIGGTNPLIPYPIKAKATISEVTLGQIREVQIISGGYGFTPAFDSTIDVIYQNQIDPIANCIVSLVDQTHPANIAYFPIDTVANNLTIMLGNNFNFSSGIVNANSTLANSFSFSTFQRFPITDVITVNGGGGYATSPSLKFSSLIKDTANVSQNLKDFGILAPITIVNSGYGYTANDTITISGGSGNFAFAKINSVNASGSIISVDYYKTSAFPYTIGGMGYTDSNLPTINVASVSGSNANFNIPGILGSGVIYDILTDKLGQVTKISLSENGEDYIQTPNVSLKIQDVIVSNTTIRQTENCILFQGGNTPEFATFFGYPESFVTINEGILPSFIDNTYSLRIYNFSGQLKPNIPIKLYDTVNSLILDQYDFKNLYSSSPYIDGINAFGDGTARAKAKFLDGLIIGDGKYLNNDGQPSAFSYLQSDVYNSSTYFLSSEKDFDSYKETIFGLTHPLGSKIIPINLLRSTTDSKLNSNSNFNIGIANTISVALIQSSNSQICFSNTYSVLSNLQFLSVNTNIFIETTNDMNVYSTIKSIDSPNSKITLSQNKQYKFSNLYSGSVDSNTFSINTVNYPSSKFDANTFVYIGDKIQILGNNYTIVNKSNNILQFNEDIEKIYGIPRTFISRASVGTYIGSNGIIQTASVDTARYNYNATNLSLAPTLLIEPACINLLTYSQRFVTAVWALQNMTRTSSVEIAPDGTPTASLFTVTTGYTPLWRQTSGQTAGATFTMSGYFKAGTGTTVNLTLSNTGLTNYINAIFNLTTGTITSTAVGGTGTYINSAITSLGNGWYRCSVTGIVDSSATLIRTDYVFPNSSTIYAWGAQLEAGSTATSYVPSIDGFISRSSNGTYISSSGLLKIASTNTARYNYTPTNLTLAPNLLLETSANNLFRYSENFDNSLWTKAYTTISLNSTTAPDGTLTADFVGETANTSIAHNIAGQAVQWIANTTYTTSYYFKAGTRTKVMVGFDTSILPTYEYSSFDLIAGTANNQLGTNHSHRIENIGNNWYRCSVTANVANTISTSSGGFQLLNAANTNVYTGDGTSGLYFWGGQLEVGSSATSYIPSTDIFISRANTATYIASDGLLKIASANTARYNYTSTDLTLAPKLLLEPAATNLFTYSENFDDASWSKSSLSVISNAITAPDGSLTADKLVEQLVNSQHLIYESVGTVTIGSVYTVSCYVKAAERTQFIITSNAEAYIAFNLTTGTVIQGSNVAYITAVGSGWYRCSAIFTKTNTNGTFYLGLWNNSNSYLGDGTSGLYLWGAQLEAGYSATSYKPSTDTFISRSSPATYFGSTGLIQSALSNVARNNYNPLNLTLPSKLLLEPAATNLLSYSEQFENAAWIKTRTTVNSNTAIAPDGTLTADNLIEDKTAGLLHYIYQGHSVITNTIYTESIFVKPRERTFCNIQFHDTNSAFGNGIAYFDLSTGKVTSKDPTLLNASIFNIGNGWYRITASSIATANTTGNISLHLSPSANTTLYDGDGTSGIYIWGAQLEIDSSTTSYISTTTSQVTRNVDISSSTQSIRAADISSSINTVRAADVSNSNQGIRAADISSSTKVTKTLTVVKPLTSNTIIQYSLV